MLHLLKVIFVKIIVFSFSAFTSCLSLSGKFSFFVLSKCLRFGSVKTPRFETTPYLKVGINICVAFQCSFITCKCAPKSINRKHVCTNVHLYSYAYKFLYASPLIFSNFIIICLCKNFINSPKLGIPVRPRNSSTHLLFFSICQMSSNTSECGSTGSQCPMPFRVPCTQMRVCIWNTDHRA